MFTGIVTHVATITSIRDLEGLRTITLHFSDLHFCEALTLGASVAVDGVCLTVSKIHDQQKVDFDIMLQSLRTTTLAGFKKGDQVNVERAAKEGAEVGGHLLSGHVDCCGRIIEIQKPPNNWMLRVEVDSKWMRYIFSKGFLAINGASLTVSEVNAEKGYFEVWLIPETLRCTTFSEKKVGDCVNIEIERSTQIVVDTVRATIEDQIRLLFPNLPNIDQLTLKKEIEESIKLPTRALLSGIMNNGKDHKEHSNRFASS